MTLSNRWLFFTENVCFRHQSVHHPPLQLLCFAFKDCDNNEFSPSLLNWTGGKLHKLAFLLNSVSNSAAVPHTGVVFSPCGTVKSTSNFQEKPEVCSLFPVALYLGSPRLLSLVPLTLALFYTNSLHKRQKNGQIISCYAKINVRLPLLQVSSFASAVTVCIHFPTGRLKLSVCRYTNSHAERLDHNNSYLGRNLTTILLWWKESQAIQNFFFFEKGTVIEQMLPKNNPPLFSLKFVTPRSEEVYTIWYSWQYSSFHHK